MHATEPAQSRTNYNSTVRPCSGQEALTLLVHVLKSLPFHRARLEACMLAPRARVDANETAANLPSERWEMQSL